MAYIMVWYGVIHERVGILADLLVAIQLLVALCCHLWEGSSAVGLPEEVIVPNLEGLLAGRRPRQGGRLFQGEAIQIHAEDVVHQGLVSPAVLHHLHKTAVMELFGHSSEGGLFCLE